MSRSENGVETHRSQAQSGQAQAAEQLEALMARVLFAQLCEMRLLRDGQVVDGVALKAELPPVYARWLDESVRQLLAHGWLQFRAEGVMPVEPGPRPAAAAWLEWEALKPGWMTDRDLVAKVALVESTLRVLPQILSGKTLATDVMFRQSSVESVAGVYKDNKPADFFNDCLADVVEAYIEERALADQDMPPLRLIEVGAGTGGTSARVLPRLAPYRSRIGEYCYTDLSRSFLLHAERTFGPQSPFLRYRLFDVEKPPAAQDIPLGSYDLAIATNVLHATRDIRQTLRNVKATLRGGGLLLINEISSSGGLFTHLTFGLLKGWWLYEDEALRIPGCPGLYPETWRSVLEEEGFVSVFFPAEQAHGLGQQVVVAESDGVVRQRHVSAPRRDEESPRPLPARAARESEAPRPAPAAPRALEPSPVAAPVPQMTAAVDRSAEQLARIADAIVASLANVLALDADDIASRSSFADYGLDSISAGGFVALVNHALGVELETISVFDYSCVEDLATHVLERFPAQIGKLFAPRETGPIAPPAAAQAVAAPAAHVAAAAAAAATAVHGAIAVIGMSGRFASAADPEELWRCLSEGRDLVAPVTRWDLARSYDAAGVSQRCMDGGLLDAIDEFDPLFFNISGVEAIFMDPQQRLFLQESWRALEDAGYVGGGIKGRLCGVYVGSESSGQYAQMFREQPPAQALWGNNVAAIPARIAYFLDLQGPAVTINTACSSSLVAIHHACQGLWLGETELAIAGGVTVHPDSSSFVALASAGMLSVSGRCHSFDRRANGFVPAEGVGAVVLKQHERALADGDHVYGLIRASAVNQDGTTNGLTAPSARSQERLERHVYDRFGIDPETIQLVEAHGTATELGDPIEFSALTRAFRHYTAKRNYCALATIKSNLGHATAAAGVAGLIKLMLSLRHRQIPASLHFDTPNPKIDLADSPFYVNTRLAPWPAGQAADGTPLPRRAALSSFGMSGTNVHMVIEEAPASERQPPLRPAWPVMLSARSEAQLRQLAERLVATCLGAAAPALGNLSFTLLCGRKHLDWRVAVVARDIGHLAATLQQWLDKGSAPGLFAGKASHKREPHGLLHYAARCIEDFREGAQPQHGAEQLAAIAELYVQGQTLTLERLFDAARHSRVPLPTYPFAREKYWISSADFSALPAPGATRRGALLHPLVHRNESGLDGLLFRSEFRADDPLLVALASGSRVLPATACLEMARSAAALVAPGASGWQLEAVRWGEPPRCGEDGPRVEVLLVPEQVGGHQSDLLAFEVAVLDAAGTQIACQGSLSRQPVADVAEPLPLAAIRARCERSAGFGGEAWSGAGEVLLALETAVAEPGGLPSGLLDATLQAIAVRWREAAAWPREFDRLELLGVVPETAWLHLRADPAGQTFDADYGDAQGTLWARLRGLRLQPLSRTGGDAEGTLLLGSDWVAQPAAAHAGPAALLHAVLLCGWDAASAEQVSHELPAGVQCIAIGAPPQPVEERMEAIALRVFDALKSQLQSGEAGAHAIQVVVAPGIESCIAEGIAALLRTAQIENPRVRLQLVAFEQDEEPAALVRKLRADCAGDEAHVRHADGQRWVRRLFALETGDAAGLSWREGASYVVTGGAGGIGLIVAREIAAAARSAHLVLVGRSALDAPRRAAITALTSNGVSAEYRQLDVADRAAVEDLFASLAAGGRRVAGIVHAAGIHRDNYILRKSRDEFRSVLQSKVAGLVNLDRASRRCELDFFVAFSALAGVLGNAGQADYAAANAFMDGYVRTRAAQLQAEGSRERWVSLDWPLWADGGMKVDAATEQVIRQRFGMTALRADAGMRAFRAALASGASQVLVFEGELVRLRRQLLVDTGTAPAAVAPASAGSAVDPAQLQARTLLRLRQLFARITRLPTERIDGSEALEAYGIDSLLVNQLNDAFAEVFGPLSKTLLYEYQTLEAVAAYLVTAQAEACARWCGLDAGAKALLPAVPRPVERPAAAGPAALQSLRLRARSVSAPVTAPALREPIAIIGLHGRYPQAEDLSAYWQNLQSGRDSVTEIPAERWPVAEMYEPDRERAAASGKHYAKWGGFLEDFAAFDPLFFGISPREAYDMDPQERLFVESSWAVLEDAGYTRERLARRHGSRVGVFAGITKTGFELHGPGLWSQGESVFPHTSFGSVANRVSYLLNLSGPSMPVDTMCSASLTAIHEACEHLLRDECELAIAGGVNLYLHAANYVALSAQRMLSSDGRCRSFGLGGDGFVPGEGVGTVLLKPLSAALRDGDRIEALIRGSSINHGGKTNGYTVPNPIAQAQLIRRALDKAGIDARQVSYIEAHGTGTSLGDPIEVAGLAQAFREDTPALQYCALGSVKSNIGHLEAAAGIAGLTKLVLQLRHGWLVPTLHARETNPNIDFAATPFVLQQAGAPWQPPVLDGREQRRIAGVSGFGAGGSNAHVLVEEYSQPVQEAAAGTAVLIVLSARTAERLQEQARRLAAALGSGRYTEADLAAIAWTLQVGREAMEERLGFVASSLAEAVATLAAFAVDPERHVQEGLHRHSGRRDKEMLGLFDNDDDLRQAVTSWVAKGKYDKLLQLWVKGLVVDWDALHAGARPRPLRLPTYPFLRERYWLDQTAALPRRSAAAAPSRLHPLLHRNTSVLGEQRYTSEFSGDEFFFADHRIGGRRLLPGVAYLEIVRAALEHAHDGPASGSIALHNVVWMQPLAAGSDAVAAPCTLQVRLQAGQGGRVGFEISSNGAATLHCQGSAARVAAAPAALDLAALRRACAQQQRSAQECYAIFAALGMHYGPTQRAIAEVHVGHGQALARLILPQALLAGQGDYGLHPSLLDAALQAAITLQSGDAGSGAQLPYAVESVEAMAPCPAQAWAWVREAGSAAQRKLDLDICDDQGVVCVRLRGFASRPARGSRATPASEPVAEPAVAAAGAMTYVPAWEVTAPGDGAAWPRLQAAVAAVGGTAAQHAQLREQFPNLRLLPLAPDAGIAEWGECLAAAGELEHLVFLAPPVLAADMGDAALVAAQQHGVLACFRLIKALLAAGYATRALGFSVITSGAQCVRSGERNQPEHAALHGLAGSLAKEYGQWRVRVLDVAADGVLPAQWRTIPSDMHGNAWAWRDGEWYRQLLLVCAPAAPGPTRYRQGGVYVVIGGAGGIGETYSEYLIRTYQAQVIWLGRRAADERIAASIARLGTLGPAPVYFSADATDAVALQTVHAAIIARYGAVHGVVQAAIHLSDQSLGNMDEARFQAGLTAKVDVAVNLARVFGREPPDFVLFFSSLQTFSKAPGQSNYAAGCTFGDAFAQRLAHDWPCAVKVINWGYWGSVGIVATPAYRERMAMLGFESIEPEDGMAAIERLLAGPHAQQVFVKITRPLPIAGVADDRTVVLHDSAGRIDTQTLQAQTAAPLAAAHAAAASGAAAAEAAAERTRGAERLLAQLLAVQLRAAGLLVPEPAADYRFDPRWLRHSLRLIAQQGIDTAAALDAEAAWAGWRALREEWQQEPGLDSQADLLEAMLKALPEILAGRKPATDILFRGASMKSVGGVYKGTGGADYFNTVVAETVAAYLALRGPDQPVRVFEIGAGTGATSAAIFDRLRGQERLPAEYCYSDISRAFLLHAQDSYAPRTPYLSWRLFNAEQSPAQQDIVPGSYDIVVATNVLHATGDIRRALRNAKALLRRDGLLVLNEMSTGGGLFTHLTFGLTKGWWLFGDEALRIDGSPALSAANWQRVLEDGGFDQVLHAAEPGHALGQQVIVARSDGLVIRSVAAKPAPSNLPEPPRMAAPVAAAPPMPAASLATAVSVGLDPDAIRRGVREAVGRTLRLAPERIADDVGLQDLGVDSIIAVGLVKAINDTFAVELPTTIVFDYNTVERIAAHIAKQYRPATPVAAAAVAVSPAPTYAKPAYAAPVPTAAAPASAETLHERLRSALGEVLRLDPARVRDDVGFADYGVDSIIAVGLVKRINDQLGLELPTTIVFDYNTVEQLARHIGVVSPQRAVPAPVMLPHAPPSPVFAASTVAAPWTTAASPAVAPVAAAAPIGHSAAEPSADPHAPRGQRVVIRGPGSIDELELESFAAPALGDNEVRIATRAFALNFGDLLCVSGLYPTMPPYPFTPGFEASGVVLATGAAVRDLRCGDEVVALLGSGAQSSIVTCDAGKVFVKPASLSFEEGCSLWSVGLTMVDAFRKARLRPGERILIQTATGGTGLIAVQLARHYGAEIFATAGSAAKLDYLAALGVPHRINYRETDFEAAVRAATGGRGVDVVINTLPGDALQKGINCLAPGGRYIEIAMTALKSARQIDLSVLDDNQTFHSVNLRKLGQKDPELLADYRAELTRLVDDGVVRPTLSEVLPLERIKDAYACLQQRRNIGKVVVTIPPALQVGPGTPQAAAPHAATAAARTPIAIIGMSGRFASAANVDELWAKLAAGEDMTRPVTRWDLAAGGSDHPRFRAGLLDDIAGFDAPAFNIAGIEATYMDPQQRLFLEEAWNTLENAGYAGSVVDGRLCGVYVGCGGMEYSRLFDEGPPQAFWGNAGSVIPARIAYHLNLQGPALMIDTACSSSLVAVHLACQALWGGEIDMALAGGVFLQCTPAFFLAATHAGMLSTAGRCHAFDDRADGFVSGEGVGAVMLRRLADAEVDGDTILAVIRGCGINQDGTTHGITAPSAVSQERLERQVYGDFGIDPDSIGMVEAHGTGTKLGDPIEFRALTQSFGHSTQRRNYCALGSIKTNIGHAAAAAGVAGLIKAVLALRHRQIPPSLHFERGNSHIDFANSPFFVNTTLREWAAEPNAPRRAAVSSFGFSGTNAHLVVEEAPPRRRRPLPRPAHLIVLSARTAAQLRLQVSRLEQWLAAEPATECADLAFTLLLGRRHFMRRLAWVVRDGDDLRRQLRSWLAGEGSGQVFASDPEREDQREQDAIRREGNAAIEASRRSGEDHARSAAALRQVAQLFVEGYRLDYARLFEGFRCARIPLPTYPFARERHWVPERTAALVTATAAAPPVVAPATVRAAAPVVPKAAVPPAPVLDDLTGAVTLVPSWEAEALRAQPAWPSAQAAVAAVGGTAAQQAQLREVFPGLRLLPLTPDAGIAEWGQCLAAAGELDHLVFLAPPAQAADVGDPALIAAQQHGVLACFRLIKALLAAGYAARPLGFSVITAGAQRVRSGERNEPEHAALHGLAGSLAKEYSRWRVRGLDVAADGVLPAQWRELPADPAGNAWAWRDGAWYREQLLHCAPSPVRPTRYREGGVYVVIGGAGGIGEAYSEYLIRTYQAQVIWLGRRAAGERIGASIARLGALGPAPAYFSADATDAAALQAAHAAIIARYGAVHGVVQAAINLSDQSLANMDEARFRAGLTAKVDVAVNLARVFGCEPPDFVLFFSSLQTFSKAPGQSNYAAGCTFGDAFAQRLAHDWPCAVRVINWGYWGSVGVAATPAYRERMARLGFDSIEPEDGMAALERLLAGPQLQHVYAKMNTPGALALAVFREPRAKMETPPRQLPSLHGRLLVRSKNLPQGNPP